MNKRIILFLAPGLFLYTMLMIIPACIGLIIFFAEGHSIFPIDKITLYAFKNTLALCILNAIFQIAFSVMSGYLMLKTKQNSLFLTIILLVSFIPIVATTTVFLYFMEFNFGTHSFVTNLLGINLFEYIKQNEYIIIILIAFFSAMQWIGIQSLFYFFMVKDAPKEIYDLAKLDGISGFELLFKILQHYYRHVIGILTFSIMISSLKIYEVSKVFSYIFGKPRNDLFTLWNNSYILGDTEFSNYLAVILCFTIIAVTLIILLVGKLFRIYSINYFKGR